MARRGSKKTKPVSVRLTEAERILLLAKAGNQPISVYMRDLALGDTGARRSRAHTVYDPGEFRTLISQVLGIIGKSEALSSLHELKRLAKLGALPVTDDTEQAIQAACKDIHQIKPLLMKALRVRER